MCPPSKWQRAECPAGCISRSACPQAGVSHGPLPLLQYEPTHALPHHVPMPLLAALHTCATPGSPSTPPSMPCCATVPPGCRGKAAKAGGEKGSPDTPAAVLTRALGVGAMTEQDPRSCNLGFFVGCMRPTGWTAGQPGVQP